MEMDSEMKKLSEIREALVRENKIMFDNAKATNRRTCEAVTEISRIMLGIEVSRDVREMMLPMLDDVLAQAETSTKTIESSSSQMEEVILPKICELLDESRMEVLSTMRNVFAYINAIYQNRQVGKTTDDGVDQSNIDMEKEIMKLSEKDCLRQNCQMMVISHTKGIEGAELYESMLAELKEKRFPTDKSFKKVLSRRLLKHLS